MDYTTDYCRICGKRQICHQVVMLLCEKELQIHIRKICFYSLRCCAVYNLLQAAPAPKSERKKVSTARSSSKFDPFPIKSVYTQAEKLQTTNFRIREE